MSIAVTNVIQVIYTESTYWKLDRRLKSETEVQINDRKVGHSREYFPDTRFQIQEIKNARFVIGTSSENERITLSWGQMMDSIFGILFLVRHGYIASVAWEIWNR